MKLTRRGRGVVVVLAAAAVSAFLYGPRGLDAIVLPGLVALGAAVVQLRRVTLPEFERTVPERGSRGETVTVRFDVDGDGAVRGRFHDDTDEGLEATGNDRVVTFRGILEYDLTLASRGEQSVGPLTIEVTDVLGLASTVHRFGDRDSILVRPRVRPLSVRPGEAGAGQGDLGPERGGFEYLREYEPGDPIRDIHWKSSAKTTEGFLVTEFSADQEGVEAVTVGIEALDGDNDETAEAAASLVVFLLESGLEVGLRTFSTGIAPAGGVEHRERILDLLAYDHNITGSLGEGARTDVDLLVRGGEDGVALEAGGRTLDIEEHLGSAVTDASGAADQPAT